MKNLEKPLTAKSWDSYKDTLYTVLDTIKPKHCFEWGPGLSTKIMALYPSVELVDSVEHSKEWFDRFMAGPKIDGVAYYYCDRPANYVGVHGRCEEYDLIFVDGNLRTRCLARAKWILKEDGVIIVHDAEREWYHTAIREYPHFIFKDNGSTAVLSYSKETFEKVKNALTGE